MLSSSRVDNVPKSIYVKNDPPRPSLDIQQARRPRSFRPYLGLLVLSIRMLALPIPIPSQLDGRRAGAP